MAGGTPFLIVIQGKDPGSRYKLPETRVTSIGRSSQNQISLVNPTVSRFHCEIAYSNGLWYITDLNSKAGTRLNGDEIDQREQLESGDVIRIGSTLLKFEMAHESAKEDDSLLAIKGAVLDAEVKSKGEAVASFDDVRQRSQFAAAGDERQEPEEEEEVEPAPLEPRHILENVLFVGGAALLVALAVFGVSYPRYRHVQHRWDRRKERREDARLAYTRAVSRAEGQNGSIPAALRGLEKVEQEYADTPFAAEADRKASQIRRRYVEEEMQRISRLESEGSYGEVIAACDRLEALLSSPELVELVQRRRESAVRMARAALDHLEKRAGRVAMLKRPEDAIGLYREAAERADLPWLRRQIEQRMEEFESRTQGTRRRPGARGGTASDTS